MAEEDKGLLSKTGDFLYDTFVWDDEASLGSNLFWTGLSAASIIAIPFTGGVSASGLALRGAAKAGTKALTKTAVKQAAKEVAEEGVETAAKKGVLNRLFGRVSANTADNAAETVVKAAKPGFMGAPVTRGGMMAFSAATTAVPIAALVGLSVAEHESGGALSEAAINGCIETVKAGLNSKIITYENLEAQINRMGYIIELSNVWDKAAQDQAVLFAMGRTEDPSAEEIRNGKIAAVSWQLTNLPLLAAKNLVRMGVVDEVYPDKNEADKYMAEQFVNDLIDGSNVRALEDHPVTEDDVKTVLKNTLHSSAGVFLPQRLKSGLEQLYPDLFEDLAPEQAADNNSIGSRVRDAFNSVRETAQDTADEVADNWLMTLPGVGPLIGAIMEFFKWIGQMIQEHVLPMFTAADRGDLAVQGSTSRLAGIMQNNGHNPRNDATVSRVSHDGSENDILSLIAITQQPGPAANYPARTPG